MNKILIADDIAMNRDILALMLQDRYTILEAENGEQVLEQLSQYGDEIVAVLLDLDMPKKNGFEVLRELQQKNTFHDIPVLIITSDTGKETENECLELGAFDFIAKPFYKKLVERRVHNAIEIYANKRNLEQRVAQKTADLEKVLHRTMELAHMLEKTNEGITEMLGTVVEYRNLESGEHIQRVKHFTDLLGKAYLRLYPEVHITESDLKTIVSASALHDIGKIAIPDAILMKPGRLTPEEYEVIKTHTTKGADFLRQLRHVWNQGNAFYEQVAIDICEFHHERWDGRGYPKGLKGDEIPLPAQLVAVADVYDALVHERCYKSAFSPEEACKMIREGQCGAFSEKILLAFETAFPSFCNAHVELDSLNAPKKESCHLQSKADVLVRVQEYRAIGVWALEMPENAVPRLFIDDTMEISGGFSPDLTPEEAYLEWEHRVLPEDLPAVYQYLQDVIKMGTSEVSYRWNHPMYGIGYIRCGGALDVAQSNTVRLIGFHRHFASAAEVV